MLSVLTRVNTAEEIMLILTKHLAFKVRVCL